MKSGNKTFALVVASVLLVAVVATNLHQVSAFGFVERQQFKKLTHEFEKNVITTIKDEGTGPVPHLRELLLPYIEQTNMIFLGGPDTIPPLTQSYERDVTTIFDSQPPEPDKQIKDFRSLTHDFEKAVIDAVSPPEPE